MDETRSEIAERREKLKWSQAELAAAVRMLIKKPFSQQALARLEKPGADSRRLRDVLDALTAGEAGRLTKDAIKAFRADETVVPVIEVPSGSSSSARLTSQEISLIEAFRELQRDNKEQARLVMQVAFGADPRQQIRSVQQDKLDSEVMAGFDMAELGTKIDAYYGARSATEKIAAADKVVSFIDRRQRQEYPPDKEFKRASDLK